MSQLEEVTLPRPRPTATARQIAGPRIIGVAAVALLILFAHALATAANTEEATRLVIRQTARLSLILFCAAFAASSLLRLWPMPLTRWMMRNRRWLGLSFALSHFVHLAAILMLGRIAPDFEIEAMTIVFGGLAYVFIAALAATSFDGAVTMLGKRRWQLLHKTGMYYIWFIFAQSYTPRAFMSAAYIPAAALLFGVIALRIAARKKV